MSKAKKKPASTITRLHPELRQQGLLYRAGYGEIRRLDWEHSGLWVCVRAGILHWAEPLDGPLTTRLWTPVLGAARDQQGRFYTSALRIDRWNADLTSDNHWAPHRGRVEDLSVSPDGQLLVSLGEDGTLLTCDAQGQELRRLSVASGARRLRVDWQAKKAWTAGELGAEQWDLASGVRLKQASEMPPPPFQEEGWSLDEQGLLLIRGERFEDLEEPLVAWAVGPDKKLLALASERELIIVELAGGEILRAWEDFQEWPLCTIPSPDGRWVISGGMDGQLSQRRMDNGELKQRTTAHADAVTGLTFAAEGNLLISAGADGTICSWLWPTMELQQNMDGHDGSVHQVLSQGDRLFSGGSDGQILVWDYHSGQVMAALTGYEGSVEQLQLAQRGEVLLALYDDGSWASWDITAYF
jgi:WD40 repeat protein